MTDPIPPPAHETGADAPSPSSAVSDSHGANATPAASAAPNGHLETLRAQWIIEQNTLQQRVIESDHNLDFTVPNDGDSEWPNLRLIAGVDISFIDDHEPGPPLPAAAAGTQANGAQQSHDSQDALACVVVCQWPDLQPVYQDYLRVPLTVPYIPGFLAFREVEPLKQLLDRIPASFTPQIVLVDGNGTLHPRRFGLACHLGVLTDLPTIGIGKNFLHIPAEGEQLSMAHVKARAHAELVRGGDRFLLQGQHQVVYGAAVRVLDTAKNPVFVSVGHRVALDTAVRVVVACCKYRVPEPVRLADLMSREVVRGIQRGGGWGAS